MENNKREINFDPSENSFSGVQDLNSIFTEDEPVKQPEKLEDIFEKTEEKEQPSEVKEESSDEIDVTTFLTEDKVEEEEPEAIEVLKEESNPYRDLAKDFFGDTFDTIIVEEDGEEVEKSLEDLDLDKDSFLDLVKSHIEEIKAEANADKIDVKDTSDLIKKIIDIDKNGGNVTEALNVQKEYQDPFNSLDLTDEDDQKRAIILGERLAGTSDEKIAKKLKFYEFEGILSEEAFAIKEQADIIAEERLEQIKQDSIQQREYEKQALKKYRGDLSSSLDSFELKPSFKKKLLDISSRKNEEGRFELDDLYSKMRSNPTESAELIMFLANKEEYLKQKMSTEITKKQVDTQKKLRLTKRGRADNKIKASSSKDEFLDMDDLPR